MSKDSWAAMASGSSLADKKANATSDLLLEQLKKHLGTKQSVVVSAGRSHDVQQYRGVIHQVTPHNVLLKQVHRPGTKDVLAELALPLSLVKAVHAASQSSNSPPNSSPSRSSGRRDLQKFSLDPDDGIEFDNIDLNRSYHAPEKYDQIKVLEQMTGRRGGFDMNDYSTQLDVDSKDFAERLKLARALEASISGPPRKGRNVQRDIARGIIVRDVDDDALFSSVPRPRDSRDSSKVAQAEGGSHVGSTNPDAYCPPHRRAPKVDAGAEEAVKAELPAPADVAPPEEVVETKSAEPSSEEKSSKTKLKLRADAPAFVPSFPSRQPVPQPQQQQQHHHHHHPQHLQQPPYHHHPGLPVMHHQAFYQGPPMHVGAIPRHAVPPQFWPPPHQPQVPQQFYPGPAHPYHRQ